MDLNKLKVGIMQKQDEIKTLESKIVGQEQEIKQLTEQLTKEEEQHKVTVKQLNERLNTYEVKEGQVLPEEIINLKRQIEEKISFIEQQSNLHVQEAIAEAEEHVRPSYETVEEKIEQRSHEEKEQFRKEYISQLQKEKDKLEDDLAAEKRSNDQLRREISEIEENIKKLRDDLRFVMSDTSQAEPPVVSVEQVAEELEEPIEEEETSSRPPRTDLHRKCEKEQNIYQEKIDVLSGEIYQLKTELKLVIDGSIGALRNCGLLDRFMAGDRVSLSEEERQELCEQMASDEILVEALINLGRERGVNLKLPFLKENLH